MNNVELSTDSTKWTRAVTDDLKHQYGLHAKAATRQIFFDAYLNRIRDKGVILN